MSLKKGFIAMLLRKIKPSVGHVNGARYVLESMTPNFLFLSSVFSSRNAARLKLPRTNCTANKDNFPISGFRRCQLPIRVCFAMTINIARGKSTPGTLGIDLHKQCFSLGQFYVALSERKILEMLIFAQQMVPKRRKMMRLQRFFAGGLVS